MDEVRDDGSKALARPEASGAIDRPRGAAGALVRLDASLALTRRDWMTNVECRRCGAVLMGAMMLAPGHYEPVCQVCGMKETVDVSGGPFSAAAAFACSVADELAELAERKRREAVEAHREGKIRGPLVAVVVPALIGTAISAGVSLLTRMLTPPAHILKGDMAAALFVPAGHPPFGES